LNAEKRAAPKVSVIIPVYNTAPYLHRCVASVVFQTLKDIEIILIDDGSTDGSLEILEEFARKDGRIRVITQPNSGCANARNKGLAVACAPYIGFVDSDDFIAPTMYETLYNAMTEHDVDFAVCGVYMFPLPGISESVLQGNIEYRKIRCDGKTTSRATFFSHNVEVWNKLFKKELLAKYNIMFESGYIYEDTTFSNCYWAVAHSAYYIKDWLYYYCLRDDSIIGLSRLRQMGMRGIDGLRLSDVYYSFLRRFNLFDENRLLFWDLFLNSVHCSYEWTEPEILRGHGIPLIKNFLKGKDIAYLTADKYAVLHCFARIGDEESLLTGEKRFLGCFRQKTYWHINDLSVTASFIFLTSPSPKNMRGYSARSTGG
jgi:glycosyltransferase involved in cell wall biosynthesis